MLPTSSDPMAPGREPRHAAGTPDGTPRGRHRRPESLADTLPAASGAPASAAPVSAVPEPGAWSDRVPSASDGEDRAWAAYLPPAGNQDWAESWATELGSTGSWRSGDLAPEPAPEPHAATADSRDAWAFESTGEWLMAGRRSRRRRTDDGESGEIHPADAAIAAARSAAAQLQQDRHSEATPAPSRRGDAQPVRGRHSAADPGDGPSRTTEGKRDTDQAERPVRGAHRAPESRRPAPTWSRITGALPILSKIAAPAGGDSGQRPKRARRRRADSGSRSGAGASASAEPHPAALPSGSGQSPAALDADTRATDDTSGAPTGRHAAAGAGNRRAAGRSGRHARPADPLAITVRPVPVVAEALQGGRRAVREWAVWTDDPTPATGSHRAPGTIPIESWLLIGRGRRQALLAALVAAGLALVMIPVQRDGNGAAPIAASGRSAVEQEPDRRSASRPPREKAQSGRQQSAGKTTGTAPRGSESKPAPRATDPAAPEQPPTAATQAPPPPPPPPVPVPPGDGPARSLRFTGSEAVALTFDDGPDPVQTPRLLALLAEHGVTATFCLVGSQVERHPELVEQIVAAGHTLCNHSWDHSFTLGKEEPDVIRADLDRTNAAIRAAVPNAKIPFFRAPGGNFTDRLVEVAYVDGMASLYWEVDPRDWEHAKDADSPAHVRKIVEDVRRTVRPGSIVLSHDFRQPDTITAYTELLPWLRDNFTLGVPAVPPPVAP